MKDTEEREFGEYLLDVYEHGLVKEGKSPCFLCELSDECDNISDDLNCVEYCICLDGIKDKTFKKNHPDSYFKRINV